MLLEEFDESFFSSVTREVNWGFLLVSWVEFDGWETGDLNTLNFVSGGVHLAEDEACNVFESLGKFVVDWGKGLAVTAPWGVVFDEDVLGFIEDDFLEVQTDDGLDGLVVIFWEVLGLELWLQSAGFPVVEEVDDVFASDIAIHGEFLEVIVAWINDSDGWDVFLSNTDVFSESLWKTVTDTGDREDDLALKGGRGFLQGSLGLVAGVLTFVEEEESWDSLTEDLLSGLLGEWQEGGELVGVNEALDVISVEFSREVVTAFIEFLEEDDLWG